MKKIKSNLLAAAIVATGLFTACSSETTTGVDAEDASNDSQTEMGDQNTMDTTNTETYPDTSYQNPPTDESGGTRDQ